MKMYRALTGFYEPKIEEIEVIKETESSIWVEGETRAQRKQTQYTTVCKTYNEAFKVVHDYHLRLVNEAKRVLKTREASFEQVFKLRRE